MVDPETAREIMTADLVTVKSSNLIGDVVIRFVDNWIGGAPVVDEHDIVEGIITDGDLVRGIWKLREDEGQYDLTSLFDDEDETSEDWEARVYDFLRQPVRTIMTRDVITVGPETPVSEVAWLMSEHRVKKLPVVQDGRLTGLVSRGDVVLSILGRRCAELFPQPAEDD